MELGMESGMESGMDVVAMRFGLSMRGKVLVARNADATPG